MNLACHESPSRSVVSAADQCTGGHGFNSHSFFFVPCSRHAEYYIVFDNKILYFCQSPSSLGEQGHSRSPFRNFPDKASGTPAKSPHLGQSSSSSRRTSSPVSFLSSQLYDVMEYDDDDDDEASFKDVGSRSFIDDAREEFCSTLQDRGDKSGFNVEYHDLSQKGYSGNYLCFVRLDTSPPTVCHGMGSTKTCAHERAAQNALQYLNTVCS